MMRAHQSRRVSSHFQSAASAERALRAMTRDGADALGLTAKGRLTRGADADLLAVDGDPFTDAAALTRVAGVWKAGVPVVPTEAA